MKVYVRSIPLSEKCKCFWSWVNYVWSHLHSSKKRAKTVVTIWILRSKTILTAHPCGYHFTVACQGCFKCTASYSYFMSIHNPTVVLKRNFLEILWATSVWHYNTFKCNYLWLLLMRNFRILRSHKHQLLKLSYFATVKRRIQGIQFDIHIKPS